MVAANRQDFFIANGSSRKHTMPIDIAPAIYGSLVYRKYVTRPLQVGKHRFHDPPTSPNDAI
jgi:hypothetical protein